MRRRMRVVSPRTSLQTTSQMAAVPVTAREYASEETAQAGEWKSSALWLTTRPPRTSSARIVGACCAAARRERLQQSAELAA